MTLLAQWTGFTTQVTLQSGDTLFKEGDASDEVYVIVHGRLAILKNIQSDAPAVLGYRGAGELVGEISLLQESPRTASAMALEETELLGLARDQFWPLLDTDPDFRRMILKNLIDRLLAADESRVHATVQERDLFRRVLSLSNEQEQLDDMIQLRQETLHFIIHDLRNPLNLVTTAMSMIEMEVATTSSPETQTFVLMAKRGVQRMLSLVEALLDLEQLEHSTEDILDRAPLNIADLLTEIHQRLLPMAQISHIDLHLDLPEAPFPLIFADRQRLDRVIINLIDNALKFTLPDDGVVLHAWHDEAAVYVAVDDSGTGIPAHKRENIFDRFVRTQESGHTSRRGFGLGLAYCRSAVEAHHGTIQVEDAPTGKGMRFVFSLPLGEQP